MKKNLYNWLPVLVYFLLIFLLSSFPVQVREGVDKFLHFLEYALLGFLIARGVLLTWDLPGHWGVLVSGGLGGLLGALDEFHQASVPGRSASLWDALTDLSGAIAGAALFLYLGSILYKNRKLYPRPHDKCC